MPIAAARPRSVNPSRIAMCSPRVRPTRRTLTPQMQRERSFGTASIYLGTIAVMAYSYAVLLPVYQTEHSVAATATVAAWSQLLGILALVLLRACLTVDPGLVSPLAVGNLDVAKPRSHRSVVELTNCKTISPLSDKVFRRLGT